MVEPADTKPSQTPGGEPEPRRPPTFQVTDLVGPGREAVILHRGERYTLRITANDKLILTK